VQEVVIINSTHRSSTDPRLLKALEAEDSSLRLQAVLAVGTQSDAGLVDALVERCAVEPDFYVRDMLTWALTRLPSELTVPRLLVELRSERAQARSQALHTLSKIKDEGVWPAITLSLLHDADDEVARSAWRAAAILVPAGERKALATDLATQLGRGDRNVKLSLSRALVALGDLIEPGLQTGLSSADPKVRAHARATERLLRDPEAAFDPSVDEAKRIVALDPEQVKGKV
jgi:HEAT repeat protein